MSRELDYVVLESDGLRGIKYPVKRVAGYNEGLVLEYEKDGKVDRVLVGRKYRPLKIGGKFWVGKNVGNVSAAVLISDERFEVVGVAGEGGRVSYAVGVVGGSCDPDAPGEDYSGLGRSDLFGGAIKSVTKKFSWLWILVAVGAVVAVIIIILYMRSRGGV